jgi:thymidylate synthase ThyX
LSSRVFTVAPLSPEKCAYALARYSRSPDSIQKSLEWVRTHDSQKFLESFYFQYGHASIADLGHVVLCFEGVSELAATEVEDEQLWDGQARSSRYQDFSKAGFIVPPEFDEQDSALYRAAAERLLAGYNRIHTKMADFLAGKLPQPEGMKPDVYRRNIAARAVDVARYLLFFGIATGVGQVTSIRTLERQVRRMKASEYQELQSLAAEIVEACASPPVCVLDETSSREPLVPTLAKYVDADRHLLQSRADLRQWAVQNLPASSGAHCDAVDLFRPSDVMSDIAATLLFSVTDRPYRELYELASGFSAEQRQEVIDVATRSRGNRDELLREFRGGLYVYDIVMDIGAYRDLHRHRRCQQFRQTFTSHLGFDVPDALDEAGLAAEYRALAEDTLATVRSLPAPGAHYLLPFAARSRFLFKMDFAEAEYLTRLRSGVKGHFSYRKIAWQMKEKMQQLEPELGRLMQATPPWVEDPLQR